MKKCVTISLIICFVVIPCVSHSVDFSELLTEPQRTALQLDVDVFGMCVSEESYPYVIKNYSTEYAVRESFEKCHDEGRSVVHRMDGYGAEPALINTFLKKLFGQMVGFIDNARNSLAEKAETKPMKAPKK